MTLDYNRYSEKHMDMIVLAYLFRKDGDVFVEGL